MADGMGAQGDPTLDALTELSEAVSSGADGLCDLHDDLSRMRRRRGRGWSWQRILSAEGVANSLSIATRVVAGLARAIGVFRRSLADALRSEGMSVTDIAALLDVSRQRVSALVRPRRTT